MSLIINVATPVGMVMAADSRQSYRNQKGMARIGSDNATKLVAVTGRVSVGIAGVAFLESNGSLRNVGDFLLEMNRKGSMESLDVAEISKRIYERYSAIYNWREQLALAKSNAEDEIRRKGFRTVSVRDEGNRSVFTVDNNGQSETLVVGIDPLNFIVAGYNKDGSYETDIVYIPGEILKKRDSRVKGLESGASWIGQTDVVTRIILGYDPRIQNIKCVGEMARSIGMDAYVQSMRNLEYVINWATMSLQDAIDLSTLLIKTTSAVQRFSDGIVAEPGDMPGVGGDIDVLVIQADAGISWISRKELRING